MGCWLSFPPSQVYIIYRYVYNVDLGNQTGKIWEDAIWESHNDSNDSWYYCQENRDLLGQKLCARQRQRRSKVL